MKALSIRQPWAWAILNLGKDIENRKWKTNYRGPLLIHAAKKIDKVGFIHLYERFGPGRNIPNIQDFQTGGIVGYCDLIGCTQRSNSPWFEGPFGFVLENIFSVDFQPMIGRLGLFELPGITVNPFRHNLKLLQTNKLKRG